MLKVYNIYIYIFNHILILKYSRILNFISHRKNKDENFYVLHCSWLIIFMSFIFIYVYIYITFIFLCLYNSIISIYIFIAIFKRKNIRKTRIFLCESSRYLFFLYHLYLYLCYSYIFMCDNTRCLLFLHHLYLYYIYIF